MPIKKHRDTHPHDIKLPSLLPYHSPQLGHSGTHVSLLESLIAVQHVAPLIGTIYNILKIKSDLAA